VRRQGLTIAALTVAALALPGLADAATLVPNPKKIVGGFAAVSSCGTLSGMSMSWTSTAGVVTSVVLGSIPSACNGGTLSVTFAGSGNTSLGTAGPVTVAGTSQTLTTSGSPSSTSVTGAYISVVGP
jgi:hypothetical protein